MATQAQILANRENAHKSTGPRSAAGKAAASQNSVKHGLSARCDVISSEDQAEFDAYRDEMLAELAPLGPTESMLADRIVSLSWRLQRTGRIQNQTIDALNADHAANPFTKLAQSFIPKTLLPPEPDPANPQSDLSLGRLAIRDFSNARVLDRLLMYERRTEHSLYKTMLELQRLRLIRTLDPLPEKVSGEKVSGTFSARGGWIHSGPPMNKPPSRQATQTSSPRDDDELCKTNPISKRRNRPELLAATRLTDNLPQTARCKTNPIKPNVQTVS